METAVAKGQKRSNREAKKPKKTAADRLKTSATTPDPQTPRAGYKDPPKKSYIGRMRVVGLFVE